MSLSEDWKKSTRSGDGGDCVKLRTTGNDVEMGDTKAPGDAPTLAFPADVYAAFLNDVKAGEFDRS